MKSNQKEPGHAVTLIFEDPPPRTTMADEVAKVGTTPADEGMRAAREDARAEELKTRVETISLFEEERIGRIRLTLLKVDSINNVTTYRVVIEEDRTGEGSTMDSDTYDPAKHYFEDAVKYLTSLKKSSFQSDSLGESLDRYYNDPEAAR